ncbi:circularly permuted type 2 ATP-grasp protein, partial [Kribbia dieselivorans]|uniref:circularly permuted type 2 ATP-grasp protein n=1 Tax=Kribbia dieselivorans TaxID=331526 RepID=UPI0008388A8F
GASFAGRWRLDPIPLVFEAQEWAPLEAALQQRARLFDAILADLYGPKRLLRDHLLPGEMFLGHDGYLLPAHGITLPGPRQLPIAAVDLAHGPDGWTVVTDRTQAPSGIGYALANRRLVTRVMEPLFRDLQPNRLRGFFDVLQHALHRAAPAGVASPRTVLLSPGTAGDTAYDQALVSTILGHPLVVADDLMVRDGAVWLRTGGRRQRVHVIHRHVDGDWMDPLDLRPDSRLGVPGLLAATRRGAVSVVNPIGAGVLENVGMAPYLDAVTRAVLGEDLQLRSPQTWWCGREADRSHVLANLERLVIRPTSRSNTPTIRPGWELDAAGRADLVGRIQAQPWAWAAQEPVEAATSPVITGSGLSPRVTGLRAFRIAVDDEYVVMAGGLAKVAGSEGQTLVRIEHGVLTKDVWVLGGATTPAWRSLRVVAGAGESGGAALPSLSPRAAGDLYWMGRYAERAESTARLVAVTENLVDDHLTRAGSAGHTAMEVLLGALASVTGVPGVAAAEPGHESEVTDHVRTLLLDAEQPGSVAFAARRTAQNAIGLREILAPETVGVLGTLSEKLTEARESVELFDPQGVCAQVLQSCLALAGSFGESIVRDEIWTFVDAGRRVERAQATVGLLRRTLTTQHSPVAEAVIVEMVLRAGDSLITYRRRMAAGVGSTVPAAEALDLLLDEPANPRSVRYQLERLLAHVEGEDDARVRQVVEAAVALLTGAEFEALVVGDRAGLTALLADLDAHLREVSHLIERTHFAPQRPIHTFAERERPGRVYPAGGGQ